MLCKVPNCPRQSKTRIGYCTTHAVRFEEKREEYFNDYKEVKQNERYII